MRRGPDGALTMMTGNNTFFVDETQIDPASPFAGGRESQFLPALPGRPRLRAERQGRRARHGASRRSPRRSASRSLAGALPQRLRPRLQPGRRAVHVRQRHGVGHRHAVVPRHPHRARRSRRQLRLSQRLGQAAGLDYIDIAAAAARRRPRIAGRRRVLSARASIRRRSTTPTRGRLVARPPALHAADAARAPATTAARSRTELVHGEPLNITDVEVGPDGLVYFTTGGRRHRRRRLSRVATRGPTAGDAPS